MLLHISWVMFKMHSHCVILFMNFSQEVTNVSLAQYLDALFQGDKVNIQKTWLIYEDYVYHDPWIFFIWLYIPIPVLVRRRTFIGYMYSLPKYGVVRNLLWSHLKRYWLPLEHIILWICPFDSLKLLSLPDLCLLFYEAS